MCHLLCTQIREYNRSQHLFERPIKLRNFTCAKDDNSIIGGKAVNESWPMVRILVQVTIRGALYLLTWHCSPCYHKACEPAEGYLPRYYSNPVRRIAAGSICGYLHSYITNTAPHRELRCINSLIFSPNVGKSKPNSVNRRDINGSL